MHAELFQEIHQRINQAQQLTEGTPNPHDCASLKNKIFLLELEQEIAALRQMLITSLDFKANLKRRLAERELGLHNSIPVSEAPNSYAHHLLWDIAALVFKPSTMGEMVELIAPTIKHHLKIDTPDVLPYKMTKAQLTDFGKGFNPVLQLNTLAAIGLNAPPDFEAFSNYVMDNGFIMDVGDIVNYPLRPHISLKNTLSEYYPKLVQKLHQHNQSLQILASDMLLYINKGMPPKMAIQQLIDGLELSGTLITGSGYASEGANSSIKCFFGYFLGLTIELQNQIRDLKAGPHSFGNIFDKEISKGRCVEEAARHLQEVLDYNQNNPLLLASPQMTPKQLKEFELRYQVRSRLNEPVIKTQKEILSIANFSNTLINKSIQSIVPETIEGLVYLLLDFHPDYYDMLWQHITFTRADFFLRRLSQVIFFGFFTIEQKQALSKALANHYHRFQLPESYFYWASIMAENSIFMINALTNIPIEGRFNCAVTTTSRGKTFLYSLVKNPKALEESLQLFPQEQRLPLVKCIDYDASSILHMVCHNTHLTKIILELYPIEQRFAAISRANKSGVIPMFIIAGTTESLKMVLDLLPVNDKPRALKLINNFNETLIHRANTTEATEIILKGLPPTDRFAYITRPNRNGWCPLHLKYAQPQYLEKVLQLLPKDQRLAALMLDNQRDKSVIQQFLKNSTCQLVPIIKLLPKQHKLKLIQFLTSPDRYHFKSNEAIINMFPDSMNNIHHIRAIVAEQTPLYRRINEIHYQAGYSQTYTCRNLLVVQNTAIQLKNRLNNFYIDLIENPKTEQQINAFFIEFKQSVTRLNQYKQQLIGPSRFQFFANNRDQAGCTEESNSNAASNQRLSSWK